MQEHDEAVNNEVVEDATATESAAVEIESSEGDQEDSQYKVVLNDSGEIERVKVEADDDNEDSDAEADNANATDSPKKGAEARKDQLNGDIDQRSEEIRNLVSQRNQLLQEQQQLAAQVNELKQSQQAASIPTKEDIMRQHNPVSDDFFTEFEAEAIVENLKLKQQLSQFEQQREQAQYSAQVSESINGLTSDAERALRDFPVFDSESPEYIPELAAEVGELVQEALIADANGSVVGAKIPIYQLYKTHYNAAKASIDAEKQRRKQGALAAQAGADVIGSGLRQSSKKFDDMSLGEMESHLRRKGLIQ